MKDSNQLQRFIDAQAGQYQAALNEINNGKKRSHWMWYIFPQIIGLGSSSMANRYAIRDIRKAVAFLEHPILGQRIIEISRALLRLNTNNAHEVFGSPDDLKLKSSMTLFSQVPNADPVFQQVLEKFYSGSMDQKTLSILNRSSD